MLLLSQSSFAQFFGGINDGYAMDSYRQAPNPWFAIFKGGNSGNTFGQIEATLFYLEDQETMLVDGDYVWFGETDTDWDTPVNWFVWDNTDDKYAIASTKPTSTTNVYIWQEAGLCTLNEAIVDATTIAECLNFNLTDTITLAASSQLNVHGDYTADITNNATFNENATATISFVGDNTQIIDIDNSVSGDFYGDINCDVIINNTGVSNADIEIAKPITIVKSATFTDGIVYYSGTGSLTFAAAATTNIGTATSFINGLIKRESATNIFTFPSGDVNTRDIGAGSQEYAIWAPIDITPIAATAINVEYLFSNDGLNIWWYHDWTHEAPLTHTSDREYWNVSATQNVSVTLYWRENDPCDIHSFCNEGSQLEYLKVAYWDGIWKSAGGDASAESTVNGCIASSVIPFSSRGTTQITFSSTNKDLPLPIKLISFNAACYNQTAKINWKTASEKNNQMFILQKSNNMENFVDIDTIAGAGNSSIQQNYEYTDPKPYQGSNYYRLLQVDYDGKTTVINPIALNCNKQLTDTEIAIYPNPFNNKLNIEIQNINEQQFKIEIFNNLGSLVFVQQYKISDTNFNTEIDLSKLKPSIYNIRYTSENNIINKKIIKQ